MQAVSTRVLTASPCSFIQGLKGKVCSDILMFSLRRYDGSVLVRRSIELGKPIIFAAMNYRLHGELLAASLAVLLIVLILSPAFGFLGGKEVKDAGVGNIGLHDRASRPTYSLRLPTYTEPPLSLLSRTRSSQMDQEVHRCVWRRSGQSNNVRRRVLTRVLPPF